MSYYTKLSTYQVETASEFQTFPTKQKAEEIYQKYVHRKIPCELFLEGILQKEFKPQ